MQYVLVVEDEPLIRMDAVTLLETAGLPAMEFDSADEALSFVRARPDSVAAVFTDINLRGSMDGIALAREIAVSEMPVPVLVTSGRYVSRPENLPDGIGFVRKPWMPLDVITAMQNAVHR